MATVEARHAATWAGNRKRQYYRLVEDTYSTMCVNGHAREEGWLAAGTLVRVSGIASDDSPWTGAALGNRPSGLRPFKVHGGPGVELLPPDALLEPVDQPDDES